MKIEGMGRRLEAWVWQYAGLSSHVTAKSVKQGLTTGNKLFSCFHCPLFSSILISYILSDFMSFVFSFLLWCLLSSFLLCNALHCPPLPLPILSSTKVTYSSHHLREDTVCLDTKNKFMTWNFI